LGDGREAGAARAGPGDNTVVLRKTFFYLTLLFVPASFWLGLAHAAPTAVFVVSCIAILPLAGLMGEATEQLAHRSGPGVGGLLNATFGNAAELIIGFMALRAGEQEIVKASLTGSILGNMLMVLGLAMLVGGWRHKELVFNRMAAEVGSGMMVLATVALVIPALYAAVTQHREAEHLESISLDISYVLILTYAASLLFQLKTHQRLFAPVEHGSESRHQDEVAHAWPLGRSLGVLLAAAVLVGFVSEFLVGAIHAAGEALGLGKVFMGVVVVAVIGNAAEHSTAVLMAARNKMDLAFGIAMGSSMQIALFVAPALVIAGHLIGKPLGLEFTMLEVAGVMLSVMAVAHLASDGRTNWFEGLQLLAIYAILAVAFFYV
jgi:Ca2+:H+ antiporter